MAEPIEMLFGFRTQVGAGNHVRWVSRYTTPHRKGQFWGKEERILNIETFCHELCKNGWIDRFAVWIVDSGGPKEAQVQSYLPGSANVPTWEGSTLAPPGEYDWTVHLQRRCGLMSNYFDYLLKMLPHLKYIATLPGEIYLF